MSVISDKARLRDIVFENEDISLPYSPSRLMPSDSSDSFMYLSSKEATRTDFSRDFEEGDDLSLDQIHILLEKARHLKDHKTEAIKTPYVIKSDNNPIPVIPTPAQNLNFKPKLNLLERHKAFQNSPLSQSTPLVSQVVDAVHGAEPKGAVRHILQQLNDEKKGQTHGLRHVMNAVEEDNINVRPEAQAVQDKPVIVKDSVNSDIKKDKSYSKADTTGYISPETTPPTSKSNQVDSSDIFPEVDDRDELMRLKAFLATSDVGKKLLESFETGAHTPPTTATPRFSRSTTSTPQQHRSSSGISLDQDYTQLSKSLDYKDEIEYLKSKLEDADAIIKDFDEEHRALEKQITEKDSYMEELWKQLDLKEEEVKESKNQLENQLKSMQELQKDDANVNDFLNSIIGDQDASIDKEFLKKNGCEHLFDSLKLSQVDSLTFVQLQNYIKEIAITLQTEFGEIQDVILTIAKFFKEDYLRLILFIQEAHRALYSNGKIQLPEIYKLNWIANNNFAGLDDRAQVEFFEKCLKQMVDTIKCLKERSLKDKFNDVT